MLKLASLSLAALLSVASPVLAKPPIAAPPTAKCIAPTKFPDAIRVEGAALVKLREIARGLPDQVDLVLLLKTAPVAVAFVNGCAVGFGQLAPLGLKPADDGAI